MAILDREGRVEINILASQIAAHAPFGGVVPELASREHLRALPVLVQQALGSVASPVELVAVTAGPGLVGALLVGVRFAAAFAWGSSLPLIAVDHLEGHLVSPFLDLGGEAARPEPERVLALVASGGHSSWYLMQDGVRRRLGQTRDDAAGESFDKVAQVLGVGYPGGPALDGLARSGRSTAVDLPRPRLKDAPFDFSFSGLKSAAIRWIREQKLAAAGDGGAAEVADFAASFEAAVVDQLLGPLDELAAQHQPELVTAAGGVAANTLLRERLSAWGNDRGVEVLLPVRALTTDNAAMIAHAGQIGYRDGHQDDPRRLDARGRKAWQPPGMRAAAEMCRVESSGEAEDR